MSLHNFVFTSTMMMTMTGERKMYNLFSSVFHLFAFLFSAGLFCFFFVVFFTEVGCSFYFDVTKLKSIFFFIILANWASYLLCRWLWLWFQQFVSDKQANQSVCGFCALNEMRMKIGNFVKSTLKSANNSSKMYGILRWLGQSWFQNWKFCSNLWG